MKKRILSFLVACFMVASTFIISKPLVHVHAVDGESAYGEWVFSGNTDDYDQNNNFSIAMYMGPMGPAGSSGSNVRDVYVPTAILSSTDPLTLIKGTEGSAWKYTVDTSTISANPGWYGTAAISYKGENDLGGISVNVKPIEVNISIEFTAPEDGVYSFEEIVKQLENTCDSSSTSVKFDTLFAFVVLKGDTIYDSYVTKVGSSEANPSVGTLEGYVSLKKDEVLKFVALEGFSNIQGYGENFQPTTLSIESLVVKKVAELSTEEDTVYTPNLTLDNNDTNFKWKLMAKDGDGYIEVESNGSMGSGANFNALYNGNIVFARASAGHLVYYGQGGYAAAVTFTAPDAGTYMMNAFAVQTDVSAADSGVLFELIDKDGNPLDSICYNGARMSTMVGSLKGAKAPLSAAVELEAGETISLVFTTEVNKDPLSSIYNLNVVKVTVPAHPGVAHDDAEWTKDEDSHSLDRPCCDDADVADEPHVWNGDNVCDVCEYVCENHVFVGGACQYCGTACAHTGGTATCKTQAVCDACGASYGELNPAIHEGDAKWIDNGDGTCSYTYACCEKAEEPKGHEYVEGACQNCGTACAHTGGTATCKTLAECEVCGESYGDVVPANHEGEATVLVNNKNGTHTAKYTCCGAVEGTYDCEFENDDDMTCECGYDRTAVVAEDNFNEVFESVFGEGTTNIEAEAPAAGAFDAFEALEGAPVEGFEYKGFNLELVEDGNYVYLRHHVILNGIALDTVKVGGVAADLKAGPNYENYYYFDVKVNVGDFDTAHVITIGDTTVVTASVYSYMNTAYASTGELTSEQINLLNALYQWNVAVANAN